MIDVTTEQLYPLTAAINQVFGRKVSAATAWRWVHRGIAGRKLEVVKAGNRVFTSREALSRFCRHEGGVADRSTIRTPRQREAAIARAERELAEAGI